MKDNELSKDMMYNIININLKVRGTSKISNESESTKLSETKEGESEDTQTKINGR